MPTNAPAPAQPPAVAASNVPALDGLRGFAALTVFVSHFSNAFNLWGGLLGSGAGQVGVMLFFALSGYLMGRLYLDLPFSSSAVLTFFRRRVARVVPLYLVVVAIAFSLGLYGVTQANLFEHLLFLRGSGVLWTIPVEVQFYALFPVLWWAHQRDPVRTWLWAAILVIALSWASPALGSGLIDHSQNATAAAMQMAEKKAWAHRS